MFNLEDLAGEFNEGGPGDPGQLTCSDFDRIDVLKNDRRRMLSRQEKATEIQSRLCDKILAEKKKVKGLADKIADLEETDLELFNYIRSLELMRYGIWCEKCDKIKKIGNRKEEHESSVIPVNQTHQDLQNIQKDIQITMRHLEEAHRIFLSKAQEVDDMSNRLKIKLIKISKSNGVSSEHARVKKSSLESQPKIHSNHRFITTEQLEDELDGQSLPSAPDFDIESIIDSKYAEFTADDLLDDF